MMRYLITVLLSLVIFKANGQWKFINPTPSNNVIQATCFLDTTTGFIAGDKGYIMKTIDGGTSWKITHVDLKNQIQILDIEFYGKNIGYAVGNFEAIFKTIDGGDSWRRVHFNLNAGPTNGTLEEVYIYDSLTVFAGGTTGLFYATTNGGATWEKRQNTGTAHTPRGFHFFSVDTGQYINNGVSGYIRKTTDGGHTWFNDTIPGISPNANFYDLKYLNRDTAFICGKGKILKTIDGGANWTTTNVTATDNLYSIYSADDQHIYIYGSPRLYKTADGGATWTSVTISPAITSNCFECGFIDSVTVIEGLSCKYIHKTNDGGISWSIISNDEIPIGTLGNSLFFTDDSTGYVAGNSGKIYKTIDGGLNWNQQISPTTEILNEIWFINRDTGFVAADDGVFLRTNDGGATWTDTYIGTTFFYAVQFPSPSVGYRAGNNGLVEKTINGGTTWTSLPVGTTNSIYSVQFINDSIGYIAGAGIKRTLDGGQTWNNITGSTASGNHIWVMSKDTMISAGTNGLITRTTDGNSFVQVATVGSLNLNCIYCTDNKHCYVGDVAGNIYYSTDGGLSWRQQYAPSSFTLSSFAFINNQKGFVFGNNGTLLMTENGGGMSEISGSVFVDANSNSVFDANEQGIPGKVIDVNNGLSTFTAGNSASDGLFSFPVSPGSYSITVAQPSPYFNVVPSQHFANFTQAMDLDTANHFAYQPNIYVEDISLTLTSAPRIRKATTYTATINYSNEGSLVTSGTITYVMDSNMVYVSSNPTASINGDTLTWGFASLPLFTSGSVSVDFFVPNSISSQAILKSFTYGTVSTTDADLSNNSDTLYQYILAPLDPNSKISSPENYFTIDQLSQGEFIDYTIFFQNIGNDTAFNVSIIDTLHPFLNTSTFEVVGSSDPVTWTISPPGKVMFNFDGIMLPDSTIDPVGSQGFVHYRIKPNSNLQINDVISNTAFIYFDFEPAIITNTATNTVVNSLGIPGSASKASNEIRAIPNPFLNQTKIVFNNDANETGIFRIIDCYGRILRIGKVSGTEYILSDSKLQSGYYSFDLIFPSRRMTCKLIMRP
jgi:photosystem II stability/assembly factor-like uncharacterized protein